MADVIREVLGVVGFLLIVAGAFSVSFPAGCFVAGGLLFAGSIVGSVIRHLSLKGKPDVDQPVKS